MPSVNPCEGSTDGRAAITNDVSAYVARKTPALHAAAGNGKMRPSPSPNRGLPGLLRRSP
jgi:hypothetical protein